MTIHQHIQDYLAALQIKGNSRQIYERQLRYFFRFMASVGRPATGATVRDVIEYKDYLFAKALQPATVKSYLVALRGFYRFLEMQKLANDITKGVKMPQVRWQYSREYFDMPQFQTLLNNINTSTFCGYRDYMLILLMIFTGLRRIEVSRIRVADITTLRNRPILKVQSKGRDAKDDFVALHETIHQSLLQYIAAVQLITTDPLFPSYVFRENPLTPNTIGWIIKQRFKEAGFTAKGYSAHSIRHSGAIFTLKTSGNIYDVQRFLRHTSPTVTARYLRLIDEERRLENMPGELIAKNIQIKPQNTTPPR